jgi:hypothetical protein
MTVLASFRLELIGSANAHAIASASTEAMRLARERLTVQIRGHDSQ